MTYPCTAKMIKAAKFDAKLRSLVTAVASIIEIPFIITNANTKNEPVPGPKNPS